MSNVGKHRLKTPMERHNQRVEMLKMYLKGYTLTMIADKFGCSLSNTRSVIHRFQAKLLRNQMKGKLNADT